MFPKLYHLLGLGGTTGSSGVFQPEMLDDPYPTYARLRVTDPVYWDEGPGRWVLTRYDDVVSVLRNPAASSERHQFIPPGLGQLKELTTHTMFSKDGAEHTRLRLLVNKAFTARAVEAMTDQVQELVNGLLAAVEPRGRMDVMADLAFPLPAIVIAAMLGVPPEDRERIKNWSDQLTLIIGGAGSQAAMGYWDYRRIATSYGELAGYLGGIADQRRREPRSDLLTALVQAEEAGDRLSEKEMITGAVSLLIAGHETTTNLIGNAILALLRHPEQFARLRNEPSLVPTAVEELLRFDSPVQFTARIAKDDFAVGGKQVRKGQMMVVLLGAANHDPDHFPEPDRLDIGRADNNHLAFGLGTHFCLGAQLARLEARVVLATLLRRLPDLRLDTAQVERRANYNLRGLTALPVAFG